MPEPSDNNSNLTDKVHKIGIKSKEEASPTKGALTQVEEPSPETSPIKPLSFGSAPVKPFGSGSNTFGSAKPFGSGSTFGSATAFGSTTKPFGSFASAATSFGNAKPATLGSGEDKPTTFGSGSAFATNQEEEVDEEKEKKFQQQDGFNSSNSRYRAATNLVVTGEEGEELVDSIRCKLFVWNTEGDEWKERGVGMLKVSRIDADKCRLVMRSDGVLKVILNARIQPQMPLHVRNDKYLEFYAPESEKMLKFLCKCKNGEAARRFEKVVKSCVPAAKRRIEGNDTSGSEDNDDTKRVKLGKETKELPKNVMKLHEGKPKNETKLDAKSGDKVDSKPQPAKVESKPASKVDTKETTKTVPAKSEPKPASQTVKADFKPQPQSKGDANSALVTPEKEKNVDKH